MNSLKKYLTIVSIAFYIRSAAGLSNQKGETLSCKECTESINELFKDCAEINTSIQHSAEEYINCIFDTIIYEQLKDNVAKQFAVYLISTVEVLSDVQPRNYCNDFKDNLSTSIPGKEDAQRMDAEKSAIYINNIAKKLAEFLISMVGVPSSADAEKSETYINNIAKKCAEFLTSMVGVPSSADAEKSAISVQITDAQKSESYEKCLQILSLVDFQDSKQNFNNAYYYKKTNEPLPKIIEDYLNKNENKASTLWIENQLKLVYFEYMKRMKSEYKVNEDKLSNGVNPEEYCKKRGCTVKEETVVMESSEKH